MPTPSEAGICLRIGLNKNRLRYHRRVLIVPRWPEIFSQDSERKQSFEKAVATYEAMVSTYAASGYELIPLPLTPIEERMDFVLDTIRGPLGTLSDPRRVRRYLPQARRRTHYMILSSPRLASVVTQFLNINDHKGRQ